MITTRLFQVDINFHRSLIYFDAFKRIFILFTSLIIESLFHASVHISPGSHLTRSSYHNLLMVIFTRRTRMTAKGDNLVYLKWVIMYHHNSPNITSHHHPIDLSLMGPQLLKFPRGSQKPWYALVCWGWWFGHRLGVSQRNFTDTPNLRLKGWFDWFDCHSDLMSCCLLICRCFFRCISKFWIGGFVTEILRHWQFFVHLRLAVWHYTDNPWKIDWDLAFLTP